MAGQKLLVADDEPKILKFLTGFLQREGYEVRTAANGEEVLAGFHRIKPDLIILDVMMPGLDGFEACRRIRAESNVPVIFLSAKNETLDKIMGLALGCDDYLTKPFDGAELLLRIKAILRRTADSDHSGRDDVIGVPGLEINRTTRMVVRAGQEIALTPKEFNFLWLLARHPNRVFTRDQLLYQIWETDFMGDAGIVTTLVKRLREKIEPDAAKPRYVKTVRGVGYKFGEKPC